MSHRAGWLRAASLGLLVVLVLSGCSSDSGGSVQPHVSSLAKLRTSLVDVGLHCRQPEKSLSDGFVAIDAQAVEKLDCSLHTIDVDVSRYEGPRNVDAAVAFGRRFQGGCNPSDVDVTMVVGDNWVVASKSADSPHAIGTPAEVRELNRIHQRIAKATGGSLEEFIPGCH